MSGSDHFHFHKARASVVAAIAVGVMVLVGTGCVETRHTIQEIDQHADGEFNTLMTSQERIVHVAGVYEDTEQVGVAFWSCQQTDDQLRCDRICDQGWDADRLCEPGLHDEFGEITEPDAGVVLAREWRKSKRDSAPTSDEPDEDEKPEEPGEVEESEEPPEEPRQAPDGPEDDPEQPEQEEPPESVPDETSQDEVDEGEPEQQQEDEDDGDGVPGWDEVRESSGGEDDGEEEP